jgi:hypothetical protein
MGKFGLNGKVWSKWESLEEMVKSGLSGKLPACQGGLCRVELAGCQVDLRISREINPHTSQSVGQSIDHKHWGAKLFRDKLTVQLRVLY